MWLRNRRTDRLTDIIRANAALKYVEQQKTGFSYLYVRKLKLTLYAQYWRTCIVSNEAGIVRMNKTKKVLTCSFAQPDLCGWSVSSTSRAYHGRPVLPSWVDPILWRPTDITLELDCSQQTVPVYSTVNSTVLQRRRVSWVQWNERIPGNKHIVHHSLNLHYTEHVRLLPERQ